MVLVVTAAGMALHVVVLVISLVMAAVALPVNNIAMALLARAYPKKYRLSRS